MGWRDLFQRGEWAGKGPPGVRCKGGGSFHLRGELGFFTSAKGLARYGFALCLLGVLECQVDSLLVLGKYGGCCAWEGVPFGYVLHGFDS